MHSGFFETFGKAGNNVGIHLINRWIETMPAPVFPLDQLRTLVAVVEAGSVTAGAPRVFLSQSAVSEQLRKLEELAGHSLLLRSKSGVVLTPEGQRLMGWARQLLALKDEAYRDLKGVPLAGQLRVGVTDYFRSAELTLLLARMQARYPRVSLQVSVLKSGLIESAYAAGELDVGLTLRVVGASGGWRHRGGDLRLASPGVCWHCPRPAHCINSRWACCRDGACPLSWFIRPRAWRACSRRWLQAWALRA